jgi:guanylate kinase
VSETEFDGDIPESGENVISAETYDYDGKQFDQSEGVKLSDEGHQGAYRDKVTTYNYNGKRIPVPIRWHPNSVIRRIVEHNKRSKYTGVTMIGMSGTGKTTLTNKIIHQAHMMGENYIVKRMNGHDMLNIDKHIKDMRVGFPHILVFDDASYTMEDAKASEIAKLANALTTIRHVLKSRVIVIINFHYSRATKKFFRNQHFTFLSSVSVEELSNYAEMYKDKMNVVRQFARQYNNMTLRGYFMVPISSFEKKVIKYKMDEPFRIALVAEIADLHFMVYDKDECPHCIDTPDRGKHIDIKTKNMLVDHLIQTHKDKRYRIRTTLEFFLTVKLGRNFLSGSHDDIWRHLMNLDKTTGLPDAVWEDAWNEVKKMIKRPSRGTKNNKQMRDKSVMEIAKMIKDEMAEKETPDTSNPDYDSHYTPPPN